MANLPDDFVEYLAKEARSAEAAIHQYMENPYRFQDIHLFVEGDDDGSFYCTHVRTLTGQMAHHYVCGRKSEVIRAFHDLGLAPDERVIFVVDRNHEDFTGDASPQEVYTTDFYSYESFYVSPDYVDRFVAERLNLPRSNALHASIVSNFAKSELSFSVAIRPLMALALAVREAGGKLNLNNLTLDSVFAIKTDGTFAVTRDSRAVACRSVLVDHGGVTASAILRWRRRLSLSARLNWLRGKYYLWALFRYLKLVSETVASARSKLGIRRGRMPTFLASYPAFVAGAPLPDCPASFADALLK
jgi:hypothetical protein